jgi:hypothetical protein
MPKAHDQMSRSGISFFGKSIVLASKHQKLELIKPVFDELIACELFEAEIDTDQLGTFTGEITRTAPPRETAILKARLGMEATSTPIGIASEGSIGSDPLIPFIHSDIEHMVLVDDVNDIVISEVYRSLDITAATITAAPGANIDDFLRKADFPNHGLIVRPNDKQFAKAIKGITELKHLTESINSISEHSPDGLVVIESDFRAHFSPSRQKNIQHLAKLLALRVTQCCPECDCPGWGRVGYEKGLKCSDCGLFNPEVIRQEILGCVKCEYQEAGEILESSLSPARCDFCNP